MKKNKQLLGLFALALGLFTTSCDDNADDPKYRSLPPEFKDVEFYSVKGDSTTLTLEAGEKYIATGVQKKKGRLIHTGEYNWSASPVNGTHSFRKKVIYDKESFNPTDTLSFEHPGRYTLTFKGRYHTSGQAETKNEEVEIDNGKITYRTPTFLYFDVTIEKKVVVK